MGVLCSQDESKRKSKDKNDNNDATTIINLDEKIKENELKINQLEALINSNLEEAKKKIRNGDKSGAKIFIAKKMKLEKHKKILEGAIDMLEEQKMNIENAQHMQKVVNVIKTAKSQIKDEQKEINIEELENIKEDMNNMKEQSEEVNEFLTGFAEVDENDVDNELEKELEDMANNINEEMPNINDLDNIEDEEKSEEKKILESIVVGEGPNLKFKQISPQIKKEKIEREKIKKEIFDKQKDFRINNINDINNTKKEEVKGVLEDMCIMGSIMKKEIMEEKKFNPEKFIPTKKALSDKDNKQIFCLGVLAQNLENLGIVTAIEKNPSNDEDTQNASNTILQFITNGLIYKNKYNFHFDLGTKRNNELLTNKIEQKKFNDKLRKKLSIEYNIPENKIILTNPQRGSYEIQVIFETDEFNQTDILDMDKFRDKCKNDANFKELCSIKKNKKGLIMEGCKLNQSMLDSEGNRESGWEVGGTRGGYPYTPPEGWIGYGLKVRGKYDNGNDDWLACNGNTNEWAVAYHGVGRGFGMTLENAAHNIIVGGFKAGGGQYYESHDDANHPGQKVGRGVYCSPEPKVMDDYAQSTKLNGKSYKMGFMMRVKPNKIRYSNKKKDYWVLDGTTEQMRPYRLMIKEDN